MGQGGLISSGAQTQMWQQMHPSLTTRLAVWIISTISASLRCRSMMSLRGQQRRSLLSHKLTLRLEIPTPHPGPTHMWPIVWAVARATKNTMTGRNFLPPAPKICSAAAMSIGCLLPTTSLRLAFIVTISWLTGCSTWLSTSLGLKVLGLTESGCCCWGTAT